MPLVRIAILKGRTPAQIRAIADGVHQALVATFDTPLDDRFALIQQHDPGDLIYNSDYLDIQRSDGIVIIHIVAIDSRSTATKKAFYKAVIDNLAHDPGVRPEDVQIILSPNAREDWSFGGGAASYVNDDRARTLF